MSPENDTGGRSLEVRLIPISSHNYSSQLYAGLFDLAAAGRISLEISSRPIVRVKEREWGDPNCTRLAYVEVSANGGPWRTLCYDFLDGPEIISPNALRDCDLYFKRSYSTTYLSKTPEAWGPMAGSPNERIRRYGLNYPCTSPDEFGHLRRALIECSLNSIYRRDPRRAIRNLRNATLGVAEKRLRRLAGRAVMTPEFHFSNASEDKILLQTRVFTEQYPDYVEETENLNESRVRTIRLLKSCFADRFVGGLVPSKLAIERYPDCITTERTGRRRYLDIVRRCAIAVHTAGKRYSIGWRLPEYLALSRAVVAEPLAYEIPDPLLEEVNLLSFDSPESCAAKCDWLLSNPRRIAEMRKANYEYYLDNVRPAAIALKTLLQASRL